MASGERPVAPDALRVFLSSRMEELAPERAAVRAALEAEGVLAWAFEADAGARPGSARQTYLEELAVSDVYVGIFWKGYGAYTVDEFDAAGASELPRLVYEKTTEAADREPKLQAFLDEVGDVERGATIRRFATPSELGELVAGDIRRLRSELKRIWGTEGKTYTLTPNGARFDRTARMTPIRRESQDITDCLARPDHFIDRVDALNRVREAIASGETMVGYVGEPGIGKTAVMRSVAHDRRWTTDRFPDGVGICVLGDPGLRLADLLRTLWAFFYRVSDRTYVPDDVEVRRDLVGKKALIFIDDIALPPDQVERLGGLMPNCVFVVTAGGPASDGNDPLSFVKAVPLKGFDDPEDMVELFSAVYRRPVAGPAREDVARLCIAAGGSPGRITRLANEAWGSGASLDEWLVERSARGGEPVSQSLTQRVTPEQRRLLLILAAFGADLATPEDVVSQLGVDADTVQAVVGSGDVEQDSPRYRLPGAVYLATSDLGDAKALRGDIFEATVEWVGEASREEVGENRVFIQRVLEWGAKNESRRGVLVLARAVEEPLALTGTWGSWGTVLDLAVAAASAEQDDDTRAWALHQRGTRARMLGDNRTARRDLRAAYLLHKRRGETGRAALSRHNLRQGPRVFPLLRGSALTTFLAVAMTLVAVAAGAAVIAGVIDGNGGTETTSEPGTGTTPGTTPGTTTTTNGGTTSTATVPPPSFSVTGEVVDGDSGQPLSPDLVELRPEECDDDVGGCPLRPEIQTAKITRSSFSFDGVPQYDYFLVVEKTGYEKYETLWEVTDNLVVPLIELVAEFIVTGEVVDGDGDPLSPDLVELRPVPCVNGCPPSPGIQTAMITGSSYSFHGVPQHRYQLVVEKPGYKTSNNIFLDVTDNLDVPLIELAIIVID